MSECQSNRISVKKVLLNISQNSQENFCAGVSVFDSVADSVFWFVKKNVFLYIISEHLCNAASVGTDSQTIYEK